MVSMNSSKSRAAFIASMIAFSAAPTLADEGGVSVYLPGFFGSLAAAPGATGWSLTTLYYHSSVDAGGSKNFPIGGRTTAGIDASADLFFALPAYTFETPVLGAQLTTAVGMAYGEMDVSADASLTGPRGRTIEFSPHDSVTSNSDLLVVNSLKWNDGTNNYMAYALVSAPVGSYDQDRLANVGTNHWAIDSGGAYTYFNPKTNWEFSTTLGFTYNFENDDTDYKNGVDAHLDIAGSYFVTPLTHIGVVGYAYHQLSGDSGDGATLGDFRSRVAGIGPQIGHFFAASDRKYYINLKSYYEFDGSNRPSGWNAWLSLLIPLQAENKR